MALHMELSMICYTTHAALSGNYHSCQQDGSSEINKTSTVVSRQAQGYPPRPIHRLSDVAEASSREHQFASACQVLSDWPEWQLRRSSLGGCCLDMSVPNQLQIKSGGGAEEEGGGSIRLMRSSRSGRCSRPFFKLSMFRSFSSWCWAAWSALPLLD